VRPERPRRHPNPRLRWIDDRLPELSAVHRLGISFDLILAIAVWMRILPATRPRAFRKVVTLLKPGGLLWLLLRYGPDAPRRPTWAAKEGEIEALATNHGLTVVRSVHLTDHEGRAEVSWTAMCMRLPPPGGRPAGAERHMMGANAVLMMRFDSSLAGCRPAATILLAIWEAIFAGGVLIERWRYQTLSDGRPGRDWQATPERFVDPETGRVVTVFRNPANGERRYVAGDERRPGIQC
jgi:hypothetical protein